MSLGSENHFFFHLIHFFFVVVFHCFYILSGQSEICLNMVGKDGRVGGWQ